MLRIEEYLSICHLFLNKKHFANLGCEKTVININNMWYLLSKEGFNVLICKQKFAQLN